MSALILAPVPARAETPPLDGHYEQSSPWTGVLDFYRTFLSRADGNRCPMVPSCSHYAEQAFRRYGFFKGWILTCDRLLRCGRDESKLAPIVMSNGSPHVYDPLEANTFWWTNK